MRCRDASDLLRGKLSQLEHNVLAAAAVSSASTGDATSTPADAAAAAGVVPMQGTSPAVDLRTLLQSLGLGEEVIGGLTEVGRGPSGPDSGVEGDTEQQQGQLPGWQQGASAGGGTGAVRGIRCVGHTYTWLEFLVT